MATESYDLAFQGTLVQLLDKVSKSDGSQAETAFMGWAGSAPYGLYLISRDRVTPVKDPTSGVTWLGSSVEVERFVTIVQIITCDEHK